MEIKTIILEKFPDSDVRYIERYLTFISKYRLGIKERNSENHHILPKSSDCFPEYSSFKDHPWNSAILHPRAHYLAHWMCAKIFGGKQWLAFNQMRRVIRGEYRNSRLYASAREFIIDALSKANTGKVHDAEFRKMCSARVSGTVVVRKKESPHGSKCIRVSKDDEKYISGELIPNTCGRVLSEDTRRKMSENNGLKNMKEFYNPVTMERGYFENDETIPDGFIKGAMPGSRKYVSENLSLTEWWHDPNSKKNFRIKKSDDTTGLVRGRYSFNNRGFDKVNDPGMISVYNMKSGENCIMPRSDVTVWHTTKKAKSKLIRFKNFIADPEVCDVFLETSLDSPMKPHHNQTNNRREFFRIHQGKTLRELGFDLVLVKDYKYKEGDIYVRTEGPELDEYRNAIREIGFSGTTSS